MYQKLVQSTDSPTGRWLVSPILLEGVQCMSTQGILCRRDTDPTLPRTLAAINKPILFSSLVLVDPGILPPPPPGKYESWAEAFEVYPAIEGFMDGALTRRSAWKSKFVVLGTDSVLVAHLPTNSERTHWKISRRYLGSRHGIRSRLKSTWTARFTRTRALER